VKTTLYTAREVAGMYKVSVETVWRWIRNGKLSVVRLSERNYRIPTEALAAFATIDVATVVPPRRETLDADRPYSTLPGREARRGSSNLPAEAKPKMLLTAAQQEQFERFWAAYPKRQSKGQAMSAWKKVNPDGTLTETIIAGVERAKSGDSRFKTAQYIPYPATWLNAAGWGDEHTNPQGLSGKQGVDVDALREFIADAVKNIDPEGLKTINNLSNSRR